MYKLIKTSSLENGAPAWGKLEFEGLARELTLGPHEGCQDNCHVGLLNEEWAGAYLDHDTKIRVTIEILDPGEDFNGGLDGYPNI